MEQDKQSPSVMRNLPSDRQDPPKAKKKKKKIVIKKGSGDKPNLLDKIKQAKTAQGGEASPGTKKPAAKTEKPPVSKAPAQPPKETAPAPEKKPAETKPAEPKKPAAEKKAPEAPKKPIPPKAPPEKKGPRVSFEMPTRKPARRPQGGIKNKKNQMTGARPAQGGGKEGFSTTKSGEFVNLRGTGFKTPNRRPGHGFQSGNRRGRRKNEERDKKFEIRKKKDPAAMLASVPKEIEIMDQITVGELAKKMNIKASDLIGKLMKMGNMATINSVIDSDTAILLAAEYKCEVKIISLYDETLIQEEEGSAEDITHRAPIVTVMGHVDHGKTKLLDCIRNQDVVAGEAGGITQHIGAYKVRTEGGDIVFLDTPGHEAFSMMRARGSGVTDIVVIVVAADDGVMPQTEESIAHAKAAKVPIIVAINKIDKPDSNPEKIRQDLAARELVPEEWGGDTQYVEISALQGTNIDKLLEAILLQSEVLELTANEAVRASGTVLEAKLDQGRGPISHVIVQRGQVNQGDALVVGRFSGKVRAMFDDHGRKIKTAGPSTPVEILGIDGVPEAGDPIQVVESDKEGKVIASKRQELDRVNQAKAMKKVTLDDLNTMLSEGEFQEFNIIIRADVRGSAEALEESLTKLSNSEVKIKVIQAATGGIIESDVMLASASNALIIGFHVRPNSKATQLADKEGVNIKYYSVIYDAIDDVKKAIEGMLSPEFEDVDLGTAEVRDLFKVSKIGTIAGCMVTRGKVVRNGKVRVVRESIVVYEGAIKSLRRVKDDVPEVKEGFECGIFLDNFNDLKIGDNIECYETREIPRKL